MSALSGAAFGVRRCGASGDGQFAAAKVKNDAEFGVKHCGEAEAARAGSHCRAGSLSRAESPVPIKSPQYASLLRPMCYVLGCIANSFNITPGLPIGLKSRRIKVLPLP